MERINRLDMANCKVVAFYLPQFHEIEENNAWWNKGFTEWTHVKSAIQLYDEQIQPRFPLKGFYNLLNKETVIKQTSEMQQFGIYGFAYYHYWFEGRLLLEKPVENLRKWKDINQRYMFFWANHSWYKSVNGKKHLLLPQTYGKHEDWDNHYRYFSPFFEDDRYIKIDNRPVIGIYMPNKISGLEEMISFWEYKAKMEGYNGIYLINSCNHINEKVSLKKQKKHYLIREPNIAFEAIRRQEPLFVQASRFINNRTVRIPKIKRYRYEDIAYYEKKACDNNDMSFYSLCSGWDNTPRHGKRGETIDGFNPDKFMETFDYIYKLSIDQKKEFIFINAWNEWAEGMYLEPDMYYKYGLLDAIHSVVEKYK